MDRRKWERRLSTDLQSFSCIFFKFFGPPCASALSPRAMKVSHCTEVLGNIVIPPCALHTGPRIYHHSSHTEVISIKFNIASRIV